MPDTAVLRILIVDDNRGDVLLVREALRESKVPYELIHVADGEEAINYLRRSRNEASAPPPGLIVLDLNLPRRDGWEVLEGIRADAAFARTPVIVLSSSGSPEDLKRAESAGDTTYIRKPGNLEEFLAIGDTIRTLWLESRG